MRSRRPEDYGRRPSMAARSRDPRIQEGPSDHYMMPRHEVTERAPPPRRVVGRGERRNGSFEGKDFHRLEVRGETDNLRSQSTQFGRLDERPPNYDENYTSRHESRRKYDFCDTVDHGNELDTGLKHSGHSGLRGNFDGDTTLGVAEHQLLSDRRMVLENGRMHRGKYRVQEEMESSIRDAEDAERFSLSSRNPDHGRFNNEWNRYPDPFLLEKLAAIEREEMCRNVEKLAAMERIERYGKVEELIAKSGDISYFKGSASASKEFLDIPQPKDFGAYPLRNSRMNISGSYQDDVPLPTEVHSSSSARHGECYLNNRLHERHRLERRDLAVDREDLIAYGRAEFSPLIHEGYQGDYMYPRLGSRDNGNHSQTSEELSKILHNHELGSYYRGDNISPDVVDPTKQHVVYADYSQRLHSSRDSWGQPTLRIQLASDCLRDDRSLATAEQVKMRMDGRNAMNEFGDKVLIEPEVPLLDMSARNGMLRRRITHTSERDAFLVSGRESIRTPIDNQYEIEMQEHDSRRKGISSDELYTYDLSQRSLKRKKYHIDEELSCYQTKSPPSNRLNNFNGEDQKERDGKWNSEKETDLLPSKSLKYSHNINTRIGRTVDHGGDSTSNELWLSDDQVEYLQEYSSKPFKPGRRALKGLPRYGSSKSYNLSNFNQRHCRSTNVWIRAKDNKLLEESANEKWESKVMVSSSESGPPEDSEEFKQLVQEYYLSFSKILNEKIGTQKRYKEQGRAGSLYCIVCGKSSSKEFLDTRSLVTHCYMSQKVGLRAQHLGLHRAICVLLGWNSMVDRDVITFIPQVISSSEALAQKEDLILWPPTIIIHSISMLASHTGGQNVFTKEGVEDFLRGKGFSVGKIKVCPGMSANNDIMVVKFLGTFSGLRDAKNLHNYFADEKHGRTDFEQMVLRNNTRKERIPGPKLEAPLLYGYLGISEDLDKVDYDTKRRCSIKSKREIEYIAEAPLT